MNPTNVITFELLYISSYMLLQGAIWGVCSQKLQLCLSVWPIKLPKLYQLNNTNIHKLHVLWGIYMQVSSALQTHSTCKVKVGC